MSQQIERLPKGKAVCLIDADSLLYYEMNRDTLEEAMAGLDQRVHDILHQCNTTKYAGFLTQGKCFRYDVDVEYKAKRKKSNRSVLFPSLKEYAQQKWGFTYVTELEADDIVSYYSYNHEENTIICSPDKDVLKQCIGMHYNYGKAEFTHTSPDEALKFLWVQVLMGDSTDNIVGIPGVGIKTAENWLKDRTKDFESFAIRKYVEKFGMVEGITEFFKNFNLVYLLKTDEDLARYGLRLPPLQCIDISQDELDIWKDD
tara:strand:- start:4306 stop:5079 length:774 start_codon:yes stop_codon:yes gene_type:complete